METTTCNYGFEAEQPKNNYKAEGDEFIKNLTDKCSGAMYSYHFFFDTEETDDRGRKKKKLCQIAPMRSKLVYDLKRYYGVSVNPDDISTILYTTLWSNGSWDALSSFEGKCSFFAWLREVAKNAVLKSLEQEGQLKETRTKTVGNTRLALLSQSPVKCKYVIDEMLAGSKYQKLLTAIYVDRLPAEKVMKRLRINGASEYESAKKAGEDKLKDALLRSVEFSEEDILRDKTKHMVMVSSEFAADLMEWVNTKTGENPLSDVFGTNLTDEEVRLKTVEFLYDFSAKLWPEKVGNPDEKDEKIIKKNKKKAEKNERDCYIWRRRFILNVASEDVAMELGYDSDWLDTRYSRLNVIFRKAIKKWWRSHAL